METKPQIRIESLLHAAPHEVWRAITEKEMVSKWLMETNIEAKVGFIAFFKMPSMPGFDGNIKAVVVAVEENRLFSYTWQGGWMKKPTTIQFTLQEKPNGTLLILEHWGFEGILGNLLRRMMSGGWKKKLKIQIPELLQLKA